MGNTKFWTLNIKNSAGDTPEPVKNMSASGKVEAELYLYGDVVDTRPTDWWTGEALEGDFIAQDEFVADIRDLKEQGVSDLTVHINSVGGNLFVGSAINNLLKELSANVTVIIEGVAASAATVIAAAGNTVKMAKNGLYMIHEPSVTIWDSLAADDAKKLLDGLDAAAMSVVKAYESKTGISAEELRDMMKAETWMTGEEALEKGFVDELIDADVAIAMSAKDKVLVNGDSLTMSDYKNIPENIKQMLDEAPEEVEATAEEPTEPTEVEPEATETEPVAPDAAPETVEDTIESVDDLTDKYPELVAQIRTDAVKNERARLKEIDEISNQCDRETVMNAKYGENPITAKELAFETMKTGMISATTFLAANAADVVASNTNAVASEQPVDIAADKNKELAMKIAGVNEGGTEK